MKETVKLGAILFSITAICAGMLGYINTVTTPIITTQKEESKQEAMRQIMPEAETFSLWEQEDSEEVEELYVGTSGEKYIGVVVKIRPNGYGGGIELLVGINADGQITAVQILSHTETPGLGANATKAEFVDQYKEKIAPLDAVKGSAGDAEISAITGATITSAAVTDGVNIVAEYVATNQAEWIGGMK